MSIKATDMRVHVHDIVSNAEFTFFGKIIL